MSYAEDVYDSSPRRKQRPSSDWPRYALDARKAVMKGMRGCMGEVRALVARCGMDPTPHLNALRAERRRHRCAVCDEPLIMYRRDRLVCAAEDGRDWRECWREYAKAFNRDRSAMREAVYKILLALGPSFFEVRHET